MAKEIVPVYLSEGGRSIRRLRILKYILLYAGIYVSEIKSKNLSYYERKIAKRVEEEFIPKGRVRKICYRGIYEGTPLTIILYHVKRKNATYILIINYRKRRGILVRIASILERAGFKTILLIEVR